MYLLFTICDLQSAVITEGIKVYMWVSVIRDLQSAICVYFSEGKGVVVWVSVIHDLRSAFTLMEVGVSDIYVLRSAFCIYINWGRCI